MRARRLELTADQEITVLKLYHAPRSRSLRIVWLMAELGLDYELCQLDFHPKDLKSDEHRARHPLGRVPVLEDGDVTIYESGAIVWYVCSKHAGGKLIPSIDAPEYAEFLQWFHYTEGMVMPPVNTIVVHTLLLPEDRRDATVLGQAQRLLSKSLVPVNEALEGRQYLVGDFTAADIMLGHASWVGNNLGQVSDDMPNLKAYVERLVARPGFQKMLEHN